MQRYPVAPLRSKMRLKSGAEWPAVLPPYGDLRLPLAHTKNLGREMHVVSRHELGFAVLIQANRRYGFQKSLHKVLGDTPKEDSSCSASTYAP